jgi:hypothetical protein
MGNYIFRISNENGKLNPQKIDLQEVSPSDIKYDMIGRYTDKKYNKEPLNIDECKRNLIEDAFNSFVDKIIEIEHDFPYRYINGMSNNEHYSIMGRGVSKLLELNESIRDGNSDGNEHYNYFKEICNKYGISINFKYLSNGEENQVNEKDEH